MRGRPILFLVVVILAIAAFALPLALRQMPLPLRLIAGFTNLLAAFAVATVIRQSKSGKPPPSNSRP